MTTATAQAPPVLMAYLPGSSPLSRRALEQRTEHYRTWRGLGALTWGTGWSWECLDCGEWRSSFGTREEAAKRATFHRAGWCHVAAGCHCDRPHLTAAMAARLGITGDYPAHLAGVLFRMAGGVRKHREPVPDRAGNLISRCPCPACAGAQS